MQKIEIVLNILSLEKSWFLTSERHIDSLAQPGDYVIQQEPLCRIDKTGLWRYLMFGKKTEAICFKTQLTGNWILFLDNSGCTPSQPRKTIWSEGRRKAAWPNESLPQQKGMSGEFRMKGLEAELPKAVASFCLSVVSALFNNWGSFCGEVIYCLYVLYLKDSI